MNANLEISDQHKKNDSEEVALSYKSMPPKSAELYGASHLYSKMRGQTVAESEVSMSEFKCRYHNSNYLPWLEEKLAMKKKVSAGSTAPDFTINTTDGKFMKLSDFREK